MDFFSDIFRGLPIPTDTIPENHAKSHYAVIFVHTNNSERNVDRMDLFVYLYFSYYCPGYIKHVVCRLIKLLNPVLLTPCKFNLYISSIDTK